MKHQRNHHLSDRIKKVLLTAFVALLIVTAHVPVAHAQGGGRCVAYYIKYYDAARRCYVTEKRQRCTGWQRPRSSSRRRWRYQ